MLAYNVPNDVTVVGENDNLDQAQFTTVTEAMTIKDVTHEPYIRVAAIVIVLYRPGSATVQ